jgi:hypothetical protein|tara:strand:+ start:139 stop:327 length:189 start_codon:yes stop_codon:yes gene_type:complete
MFGECKCGEPQTQHKVYEPFVGREVTYMVCSDYNCPYEDINKLQEELFLEEADRQYELALNR